MEALSPYAQRFVFIGDYIFGKKSPTSDALMPEDYQFSAIPFKRIGTYLFDSVCCYIPVNYIPAGPWEGRGDKIESLKAYLQETLIRGASEALLKEKMEQILAAQRSAEPSCQATKAVLNEMLQEYPEIRWLLDNTWHPYYIAPIRRGAESFLIENWEDASYEIPASLRPDMIAGVDEASFRQHFIVQSMRYLYLRLGFDKDLLSDSLLYRDRMHAEEQKEALLAFSVELCAALKSPALTPSGLYDEICSLLQPQESFDDHPINLHHDADMLAALHRLRLMLDAAMGQKPSFSPQMEPLVSEYLGQAMPRIFPLYQRFLVEMAAMIDPSLF